MITREHGRSRREAVLVRPSTVMSFARKRRRAASDSQLAIAGISGTGGAGGSENPTITTNRRSLPGVQFALSYHEDTPDTGLRLGRGNGGSQTGKFPISVGFLLEPRLQPVFSAWTRHDPAQAIPAGGHSVIRFPRRVARASSCRPVWNGYSILDGHPRDAGARGLRLVLGETLGLPDEVLAQGRACGGTRYVGRVDGLVLVRNRLACRASS